MKFLLLVTFAIVLAAVDLNQASPVKAPVSIDYMARLMPSDVEIKHVGGLDIDANDNMIIFHRGSRVWKADSFIGNEFNRQKYGVIDENVIEIIDANTLESRVSTGANQFYMPHGVTVDSDGFVWLTDVGLHQVFKYDARDFEKPLLTLGTKFESGSDSQHFCKPTGVAVSKSTGDIYVSDGYCNRRIAQFDKDGRFVRDIVDQEQPMFIVHSITLVNNLVCAASREDGRIVCFDQSTGKKVSTIQNEHMKTVYAIEYDPVNEVIQAVTGENHGQPSTGLTFDAAESNFGNLLSVWKPKHVNLAEVHDIAISYDGGRVFTGQLNGELDEFFFERKY